MRQSTSRATLLVALPSRCRGCGARSISSTRQSALLTALLSNLRAIAVAPAAPSVASIPEEEPEKPVPASEQEQQEQAPERRLTPLGRVPGKMWIHAKTGPLKGQVCDGRSQWKARVYCSDKYAMQWWACQGQCGYMLRPGRSRGRYVMPVSTNVKATSRATIGLP